MKNPRTNWDVPTLLARISITWKPVGKIKALPYYNPYPWQRPYKIRKKLLAPSFYPGRKGKNLTICPIFWFFWEKFSVCDWESYQLKMDCFKIFYVSPMVTTKKMPKKRYTKENKKRIKACHCKQWNTKEDKRKRGTRELQHRENNKQKGKSKSSLSLITLNQMDSTSQKMKCLGLKWIKKKKKHI